MGVGLSDGESAAPPLSEAAGGATTSAASAASDRRDAVPGVIAGARLLLVALWLGGAVFFSFVVAPTAFAVLQQRELAGAVVTRTIAVVNVGGFIISLVVLALGFLENDAGRRRRARLVETVSLALVAISCGAGHWIVSARMLALRAAMGRPVDAVAADDPVRAAFNSLHGYSVGLMTVAMLAGVVALFAVAGRKNKSGV
ncbi:MAG: DUF4149 domain-containing protein [Acidobacteria bacterium]|nr:DUF4149 domain-containing protein [Acidobacteriota bacterium]